MSENIKKSKTTKRAKNLDPLDGDLSDFVAQGGWQAVQFELSEKKDKVLTIRMSDKLLSALKSQAQKAGLDTQKFVRIVLESSIKKKVG